MSFRVLDISDLDCERLIGHGSADNVDHQAICFSRQGFSAALEPVLELVLIDQTGLELTEILLPLTPEYWD